MHSSVQVNLTLLCSRSRSAGAMLHRGNNITSHHHHPQAHGARQLVDRVATVDLVLLVTWYLLALDSPWDGNAPTAAEPLLELVDFFVVWPLVRDYTWLLSSLSIFPSLLRLRPCCCGKKNKSSIVDFLLRSQGDWKLAVLLGVFFANIFLGGLRNTKRGAQVVGFASM